MLAIYPVRPGDNNPELLFSLRSLTHLPMVDEVWTVGYRPSWCQPDRHIDGNLHASPQANVYHNVLEACRATTSPEVIIMNDDFIVTGRVDQVPIQYRCTLDEHIALPALKRKQWHWWPSSLQVTRLCLHAYGHETPLSFELHTPFRCDPNRMVDTLDRFRLVTPQNPPQWRSLYGNEHVNDPTVVEDVKAFGPRDITHPFFSTQDSSFSYFATEFAAMFPEPSRWEDS